MSTKNIEDVYPLSPMQEGLLFHSLYAPEGGLYITQIPFNMKGIDVPALERAWQRIIDRHPIFRTAFVWKNIENPLQVVGRRVSLPFTCEDWRHLPAAEQEARFDTYLKEDRRRGFELNKAPLLRIVLFRTGDDTYKFLLTHHHILMDGWSTSLVFKEAFDLYEAFRNGRDLELQPTSHFREYIVWLQQQNLAEAEAFWRETLKGFTTPTPLVVDRIPGRALSREEVYVEEFVFLSADVMSALQALVRQHQLTINTVLQGAWALLLSRYSGELDVVFGAVMAGRPPALPGVESVVGLFINNLPARIRISPKQPVINWLQEVQAQQADARHYEYSPLSQVQTWSEVPSGSRLFDSIVSFQNFPVSDSLIRAGQEFESIHTVETGTYPLTLMVSAGDELVIPIRYDRRFFDTPTAERMAGHLRTLLEAIVADPHRPLRDLPLLTGGERQLFLSDWNHTPVPPPPPLCVHQLFEAQAAATPEATALVADGLSFSYAELDARSNRLARYLRTFGVGPEVAVGLCLPRGADLIVSLLGVLKAGGAYLPLDPEYPLERLSFMLEDAGVPVLLTTRELLDALPAYQGQVICLDEEADVIAAEDASTPENLTVSDNLAYVIYTSGSTGRPKGAAITHRGVVRLARGGFAEMGPGEVFLQLAPISFDASTFEVWGSLLNGARLVVASSARPTPAELGELIRREGVTTMWLTAGFFHLMVDERAEELRGLRQLLAGGDVLSPPHVEKFKREVGGCRLINGYGPTEATTFTCCYEVGEEATEWWTVPIGYPIGSTEVYILDRELELVPEGVWGELYIGGAGLARGYVNRPALTGERFVPHPFGAEGGERLYRSGDVVRWMRNGVVEFKGRADGQVKVRGYRIEVGEVEQVISRHPVVQDVIVLAREEREGEGKQLFAYVVAGDSQGVTPKELRAYVKERLPEYMVPAAFMLLDRFPLTPNGKVDAQALPSPGATNGEPGQTYEAPRNPVEETIALIWSELLHVERIGVNDNFFELGGHSIFVIQLLSRLNKTFGLDLPLRVIYDQATLAELALAVIEKQAEQADDAELRKLLAELEDISDDEAQKMLAADPTTF